MRPAIIQKKIACRVIVTVLRARWYVKYQQKTSGDIFRVATRTAQSFAQSITTGRLLQLVQQNFDDAPERAGTAFAHYIIPIEGAASIVND